MVSNIPIKLSDIVDALQFQNHETVTYVHRTTGGIVPTSSDGDFGYPEDFDENDLLDEHAAEREKDTIEELLHIKNNPDEYAILPDSSDIDEWSMLEDFILELPEGAAKENLQEAIHGKGAFARFRSCVTRHGKLDEWYAFKTERLKQIAREWLESESIGYVED